MRGEACTICCAATAAECRGRAGRVLGQDLTRVLAKLESPWIDSDALELFVDLVVLPLSRGLFIAVRRKRANEVMETDRHLVLEVTLRSCWHGP